MKFFKTLQNYLCSCGIESDEYNSIKKDAYISNFKIWKILHCLMLLVFGGLFINSLFSQLLSANRWIYFGAFLYSLIISLLFFFVIKEDSIIAQFIIYVSISLFFVFGCLVTLNNTVHPATTFIAMLLITPMFMIDRPFFMGIELGIASIVYLVWMHGVKTPDIWQMDLVNVIVFSISGFLIHVVSNSIRIKEFVLAKQLKIQKDIDDLTGLKNKGSITREINNFLADKSTNKGILFILDIDYFKRINDTYGHDIGDDVIRQLGMFLDEYFKKDEIVGRFGGDEFVFFIKNTDDTTLANHVAEEIVAKSSKQIKLPNKNQMFSASMGIAIYQGVEQNYSELFKKADIALYDVKSKRVEHYMIYQQ